MRKRWLAAVPLLLLGPAATADAMGRRQWVTAVVAHTTMTRAEARWVYVHRPGLRDEFPVKHTWVSWATKVSSPAIAGCDQSDGPQFACWLAAQATSRWCKITTIEKYRAPLAPFGDQVLFSFKTERTYLYDGHQAQPGSLFSDADTTFWGGRWHFDGVIGPAEGFTNFSEWEHRTDLWGTFSTDGLVKIAAVHSTLHNRIVFRGDGDWSTMNTEGEPGCQNP